MANDHPVPIIYGTPASQPSRAVWWTCLVGGFPFEVQYVAIEQFGPSGPLAPLNPRGQVPILEEGDFALYEMPAILAYLCETHAREDLYPKDVRTRARVNQYLHMHHNATREATFHLMAPHITVAFYDLMESLAKSQGAGISELLTRINHPDKLEMGRKVVAGIADLLERGYLGDDSSFLCAGHATIADIACYEELGQLRIADLFDFEDFPKVRRWLDAMQELPFHEQAHRYNTTLGGIRTEPNNAERFLKAGLAGLTALEECGVRVETIAH